MCWTENHKGKRSRINMDLIDKSLDECKTNQAPAMVVGMGSESLIDKRTKEVLEKVKEEGVVDFFFGTNSVLMDEDISRFLVGEEISRIEISLDAATPETYQEVRGKNELKRIESNIEILIQMKKESGTDLPVLRLCFCEQKINQHEKEQFLQKWDGKVDYIDVQNVQDFSYVDELLKTGNTNAFENLHENDLPYVYCNYPFNSLHVWANGEMDPKTWTVP
jgi:molybdenum cofactor biosynthesis enzyme MoaA